jgi:hypothetical protein
MSYIMRISVRPVHPEWAGFYRIARAKENPNIPSEQLHGFSPISPDLDAVVTAHLMPWARERIKDTNGVADDMGAVCNLSGMFREPPEIGAFYWLPVPGRITMAFTFLFEASGVRRIYMTDKHPRNLRATYLGHSIGHWSGDTLTVDTIGFNDKTWLMSGLEPHTEELHVVERIRSVADGALLEIVTTVEDRKTLTSPYTFSRYYGKTDREREDVVCNGDPGEQEEWLRFRKHALEAGYKADKSK